MLATSKNVLFPSHNHLLTTGTDDPTLVIARVTSGKHGVYLVDSRIFAPCFQYIFTQIECHLIN